MTSSLYMHIVNLSHMLCTLTGWCMQFSNFLFIKRRWDLDEREFHDKLYYLNCINSPCQLLLFPEGGDMTHKSKKRSDDYADENNLPRYQYCLHPRTTGFVYVMNALRSGGLDAVYDVTIGYPDVLPKTEVEMAKGIMPREVHFHINSYDDKDLPRDDEQLAQWCKDRWKEKEERLKIFYTHKEFQECQSEESLVTNRSLHSSSNSHCCNGVPKGNSCDVLTKSKESFLGKNYLFFWSSVSTIIFINFLMYLLVQTSYGVLYLVIVFIGQLWISVYGGGLDYIMLHYKQKDIENAYAKMRKDKLMATLSTNS